MTKKGDAYLFTWADSPVQIELDYFYETRGDLFAEILIGDTLTDPPELIHASRLNLNAANTRASLSKDLTAKFSGLQWDSMLEAVCFLAKRSYRHGEPAILLKDYEVTNAERWLLQPYIESEPGSMSVIYADGGTGKSLFAMAMAVTVAGIDQVLGVRKAPAIPVMYLDWEAGPAVQHKRLKAIVTGAGFGDVPDIHYRRMTTPLTYAAAAIRRELDEKKIGLVMIDSIGAASDGPIEESQTAMATTRAMASFKRPILNIHHMPKNVDNKRGAGAMFGSVYYANATRLAWELKGDKDEGSQTIAVRFVNTKNNNGPLERRHAFEIIFRNDDRGDPVAIRFKTTSISERATFSEDAPLTDRIMDVLREQALTRSEVAAEAGTTPSTASKYLTEMQKKGKVISLPSGKWGLAK
jgi:hypothetical protein